MLSVCDIILKEPPSFRTGTTVCTAEATSLFKQLTTMCTATFHYYHAPPPEPTVLHPAILQGCAEAVACHASPIHLAFRCYVLGSDSCLYFAAGCHATFAVEQRNFAWCSSCDVLRYCSRDGLKSA